MDRKYYIFLFLFFLCVTIIAVLSYYGIDINKEKEINYYIIKQTFSSASDPPEELYIRYYNIKENRDMRTTFSETSDLRNIRGYSTTYASSGKTINYTFDPKGKLNYRTVTTSDRGYALWNLDSIEVGQKWEGNITIETRDMENEQTFTTYYNFETEVLSYEEIKVEAGKFECYKIRCIISTEYEGDIVKQINTLWYAPDLKIIIKGINTPNCKCSECTSTSELIEYG